MRRGKGAEVGLGYQGMARGTGNRTRLIIEAGEEVPEEVISSLAGAYWLDEVQYVEQAWDETPWEDGPTEPTGPHSGMHG